MNEESIFLKALGIADPQERTRFLDRACLGNAAQRERIEKLLAAHPEAGNFLEQPPGLLGGTVNEALAADSAGPPLTEPGGLEQPGILLAGRYKLLESIGEGGMGSVWVAQQTEPVKRTVAVKLIKAGMHSKQVLARFEAERQALALMDHPNIAKVFDAGTTPDGRPFFVMELVKGVSVTKYCDEHRLTPRQRLELFVPVCQAIQHAHQKGIIHRDLKPSNVLVTLYDDRPVPKVIDFGIAKATGQHLTERTLHTGFGAVVGTLEYMSPEQAEIHQLDIDTRSDIYSLGVLLYELLTGSPPFTRKDLEKAGMLEMLRVIREQEPSKPSTKLSSADGLPTLAANRGMEPAKLTKLVKGELDWIVMKALEKDRTRRYETANGFAADVQRYLTDEPVLACPPSAGYRLRKFLRRNKGPVLAASLVALALVGGIISATWGMLRATDAEAKAVSALSAEAEANQKLREEKRQTEIKRATDLLGRGLEYCERGQVGLGLLWLARSLEAAPDDDPDLQRVIRMNLAGWHHQTSQLRAVIPRPGRVYSAAFSLDGKAILVVSVEEWRPDGPPDPRSPRKGEARALDGATGKPLGPPLPLWYRDTLLGPPGVFSADGKLLLSYEEKTAQVREVATGQPVGPPLMHPGEVYSVVGFSADGKIVLTASRQPAPAGEAKEIYTLCTWEVATGKPVGKPIPFYGYVRAVSPDGGTVLLSGDKKAQLWKTATGEPFGPPLEHPLPASIPRQGFPIVHASFSPDGRVLVTTDAHDKAARFWDAVTAQPIGQLQHEGEPGSAVFGPDGKVVLTSSGGEARIWSVGWRTPGSGYSYQWGGGRLLTREGASTGGVAFRPDGRAVFTCGSDGTIRLWDIPTGKPLAQPLQPSAHFQNPVFSPDGRTFLTVNGGDVQLWEAATARPFPTYFMDKLASVSGEFRSLGFDHDGKRVLTAVRELRTQSHLVVRFWEAATGKPVGEPLLVPDGQLAAFSPGANTVLTVAAKMLKEGNRVYPAPDWTIQVWEAGTWRPIGPPRKHGPVATVLSSRDGRLVLLRGGTVQNGVQAQLWGTATWAPLGPPWRVAEDVLNDCLALSHDGKTVLTRAREGGQLRDAATGEALGQPLLHQGLLTAAAFSPDDRSLVTGSADRSARLWDAATGRPHGIPLAHPATVTAVAFSPDGMVLMTSSEGGSSRFEGSSRFWDVPSGKPLGPPLSLPPLDPALGRSLIQHIAFNPDGRTVVTGTKGTHLRFWEAPAPPLEGTPECLRLWAETISDRDLDEAGVAGWQKADTWAERRQRLEALGGPPVPPDDVLAWHRREAELAFQIVHPHALDWHWGRIIAAEPGKAQNHLDAGLARVIVGPYEQAVADLTRAIELGTTDLRAWYGRGLAHQNLGQDEKALADYTKTLERNPGHTEARYKRGLIRMKLRQWAEAATDFSEVLKALPKDSGVLRNRALCYANLKRHQEAIEDLNQVVADQPKDPVSLLQRAGSYAALGRRDEAIADYQRVLQIQPNHAEAKRELDLLLKPKGNPNDQPADAVAHYNRGNTLAGQKKLDEATSAFRKAIDLNPDYAEAHFALGLALRDQGQFADALASLKKGHELGLKRQNWGYLSVSAQAVKDCQQLVELDARLRAILKGEAKPKDVAEHLQLAEFCLDKRRLTATAAAMYQQALATKPDQVGWFHPARAAILAGTGQGEDVAQLDEPTRARWRKQGLDWLRADLEAHRKHLESQPEAREGIRKILEFRQTQPDFAAVREAAGLAKLPADERATWQQYWADVEALRRKAQAASTDQPADALAHYQRGKTLVGQKKLDEAIDAFRKAIDLNPDYAEAHFALGMALHDEGKFSDALAALKKGHKLGSKQPNWPHPSAQAVKDCEYLADLDARLPAILKGEAKPKDFREQMDFASLCTRKRLDVAAARIYQEALTDQPSRTGILRNAASAAALAGGGKGQDAAQIDDQERARWRKQALDWLRAELEMFRKQLESQPEAREWVRKILEFQQTSPDLAYVREAAGLAKLPADERAAWEKYWADVEAIRRKAQAKEP